jgi:serine/threonine-protein kinase RsbW
VIYVKSYGMDLTKRVTAKLIELGNNGFNAVYVDLRLLDPCTPEAAAGLEALGCFFSGLLPDYSEGDILRLQYCNTRIEYDEIATESRFAERLKEYVKALDPKWRALHS